ncbi:Protein kinase domain [Dillenia turbinata]|uniref:non-specific serine/threonine protein kinase n=1 Tax=Dillenia turbinata TaxID=194707 RepID=A0AAN8W0U2_9MAGN
MSEDKSAFLNDQLSKKTSIFGLRLWVVVGIGVGATIVVLLFLISLWFTSRRKSSKTPTIPNVSKEIQEIRIDHSRFLTHPNSDPATKPQNAQNQNPLPESDPLALPPPPEDENPSWHQRIHIEIGKDHRISYPGGGGSSHGSSGARSVDQGGLISVPEVSHLGWGHWYTLRELEDSTNGFADENVIGEGGNGIVYCGILKDNTQVAVKNLLNNRGQAEKEFKIEVEAIGRVRHKNLVRLLGYCAEGAHSYVAPEYASTGMLNERSDVYSFGILIMEIISGRSPVDYSRPPDEVNLVDWLKAMVTNRNAEGVLDPKMPEKPSSREFKRALLVALRCVDPNAQRRPKMGHVIHMLEADDFPLRDDRKAGLERLHCDGMKDRFTEKRVLESGDSSGYESGAQINRELRRKQQSEEEH